MLIFKQHIIILKTGENYLYFLKIETTITNILEITNANNYGVIIWLNNKKLGIFKESEFLK